MTAQIHELLIFEGEKTSMAFCPPIHEEHSRISDTSTDEDGRKNNSSFILSSTACWRGYQGTWEIKNERFYLVDLRGRLKLKGEGSLFADWFSGTIRIPKGEKLVYVHMGFGSVYEQEIHVKIENGVVVNSRMIHNRGKKHAKWEIGLKNLPGSENRFPGENELLSSSVVGSETLTPNGLDQQLNDLSFKTQEHIDRTIANPQQVSILKKGVKEWNDWRSKKPDVKPDLSGANFTDLDLTGADLSKAILQRTIFYGSNLSESNFRRADLRNGSVIRANLQNADFREADLRGLQFGDYTGESADLKGALLGGALWLKPGEGKTVAEGGLELAIAQNLELADFGNPSVLVEYIENAFTYIHDPHVPEAHHFPKFFDQAIKSIRSLQSLVEQGSAPTKPVLVVVKAVTDEIMQYLKQHPSAIHTLRPRQFEELIAEVLSSYGWQVQLTPATKDGGYDLFAINKDIAGVQTSWIIECKKYKATRKVGVEIVRALYGVKMDLRVANAMLATTSHFTSGVNAFKASRYDLELKDYEGIIEWINEYRPKPDGGLYIGDHKLLLPGGAIAKDGNAQQDKFSGRKKPRR